MGFIEWNKKCNKYLEELVPKKWINFTYKTENYNTNLNKIYFLFLTFLSKSWPQVHAYICAYIWVLCTCVFMYVYVCIYIWTNP